MMCQSTSLNLWLGAAVDSNLPFPANTKKNWKTHTHTKQWSESTPCQDYDTKGELTTPEDILIQKCNVRKKIITQVQ